nr:unnamed protein product [Callosobruchus analis]
MNDQTLGLLVGDYTTYLGDDFVETEGDGERLNFIVEFFSSINPPGMLQHRLRLKKDILEESTPVPLASVTEKTIFMIVGVLYRNAVNPFLYKSSDKDFFYSLMNTHKSALTLVILAIAILKKDIKHH